MSTYWYLECLSHDPHLRSQDEVSQHTDEQLDRVRELWADRERLSAAPDLYALMESMFPTFNNRWVATPTSADYFGPRAVRFIVDHPRCAVELVSEYETRESLSAPTPDEAMT